MVILKRLFVRDLLFEKSFLTLAFGFIFFGQLYSAQNFREFEKKILREDKRVQAANFQLEAAQKKLVAAQLSHWPNLTASYRYLPDRLDLTDDELVVSNSVILRLSQDLIEVTKRRSAKIRGAKAEVEKNKLAVKQSVSLVLLEFRSHVLDLLEAKQQAESHKTQTKALNEIHKIAKKQHEFGELLLAGLLEIEKKLNLNRSLVKYFEERIRYFTDEVFHANLPLAAFELPKNSISKEHVLKLIETNDFAARKLESQTEIERARVNYSGENSFRLAPYVGWRHRWDSFGEAKGSAEFGVRLSFPLLFPALGKESQQRLLEAKALQRSADHARIKTKSQLAEILNQRALLEIHLQAAKTDLLIAKEKQRVENEKYVRLPKVAATDKMKLLQLDVEVEKNKIRLREIKFQQARSVFEIAAICGVLWPEELVAADAGQQKSQGLAIWIWETERYLENSKKQTELIDFCLTRKVTQVHLSVNSTVARLDFSKRLQTLVEKMHKNEILVSALIGDSNWVFRRNRRNLEKRVNFICEFNADANVSAKFDAVHLDVEPQSLPNWQENKSRLLHLLVETVAQTKSMLSVKSPELKLELDLPTYFQKTSKAAVEQLLLLADEITLMAYERKNVKKVLRTLRDFTETVDLNGRKITVGLNTKDFADENEVLSLMAEMQKNETFAHRFNGFALHDYVRFQNVVEK